MDDRQIDGSASGLPEGFDVALVLAGGATLGAYHVGACAALLDRGIAPSRVVGASIGAVTGAILLGNPPETAIDRMRDLWAQAAQSDAPLSRILPEAWRAALGNNFGLAAALNGRPGIFGPRYPGPWSILPGAPPDLALRDHRPLAATLERLIDFDRLNSPQTPPLSIVALDMQTGEEVWFESHAGGIRAEHLLAATALAPLFLPIEIDGRLLCDAGLANNLPVDRVIRSPSDRPTLCLAVDLYAPREERPGTLDQVFTRVQDLAFAMQSRRSLGFLARECDLMRRLDPALPPMIVGHVAFQAPGHERSLKSLDFSRVVLDERVAQGSRDMAALLEAVVEAPRDRAFALVSVVSDPLSDTKDRQMARAS